MKSQSSVLAMLFALAWAVREQHHEQGDLASVIADIKHEVVKASPGQVYKVVGGQAGKTNQGLLLRESKGSSKDKGKVYTGSYVYVTQEDGIWHEVLVVMASVTETGSNPARVRSVDTYSKGWVDLSGNVGLSPLPMRMQKYLLDEAKAKGHIK
eukprot:TRINITY_DN64503_c0_g1_i1.p1 TRINITY_DN64503_c0_g1~~TRINITY_DN64503_c0_g1_i1.p1  ORF type:complete len:154 (+),score=29.08 TRINITY_DN64503_c0_g1_i1:73-534(+)